MKHSETIGKLAEALAKARSEFKAVKKNAKNPFFKNKYADLSEIIDATYEALSKNGLSVIQSPAGVNADSLVGVVVVETMIAHSSGEWLSDVISMPLGKNDAQGVGSAVTYARRYSLGGVLNVAAEVDDDGEGAVDRKKSTEQAEAEFDLRVEADKIDPEKKIAQFQVAGFVEACKKSGKTDEDVQVYLNDEHKVARIEDILKKDFNKAIKWANKKVEGVPVPF